MILEESMQNTCHYWKTKKTEPVMVQESNL